MFKNEYVLKVDIKRKMTAIVPTFVQNDTAILIFKVYDNGKPFDLTSYTRAEVAHKRKDGQVVVGLASIERLGSEDIVKYQYMGNEMSKEGFVDTTLTLFSNNTRVSIQPFQISIVADIRDAIGAQEEFGVLQDLIAEVSNTKTLIDSKITLIDNTVTDANQALVDMAVTKEQAELATTNAINSATSADNKADLADQKATLANIAATNADEKATLAQQAADNASVAMTEALNAKVATVIATENAEEATIAAQTLSSNMKHTGDYDNAKQYYKGNEARQNGSSFVAIQDTLGNPPPFPPLTSNAFWEMRAQRGVDGEGSVSSVNGLFPDPDGNVNLGNLSTSWSNITEKPTVFPPSVHAHDISDVSGLQTALDNAGTKEVATQLKNGLMAKEDKTKLDGIEEGANNYIHPSTHPASIIEQDSNNRMLSDAKIAELEAKETVVGAQSKADTAESNAKIHADNKIEVLSDEVATQLADTTQDYISLGNSLEGGTPDKDNFSKLKALITKAKQKSKGLYIPNGKYYLSESLIIDGIKNIRIDGEIILPNDKMLEIVYNSVSSFSCNWYINMVFGKLRLSGLKNGMTTVQYADELELFADGDDALRSSIAYSQFYLGTINKFVINSKGNSIGWINENIFYGGRFSELVLKGNYPHNNNTFLKPMLEDCHVSIMKGESNRFHDVRFEGTNNVTFGVGTFNNLISKTWANEENDFYRNYRSVPAIVVDNGNNVVRNDFPLISYDLFRISLYNRGSFSLIDGKIEVNPWTHFLQTGLIELPQKGKFALKTTCDVTGFRMRYTFYDQDKLKITSTSDPGILSSIETKWSSSDNVYVIGSDGINSSTDIIDSSKARFVKIELLGGGSKMSLKYLNMEVVKSPTFNFPLLKDAIDFYKTNPSV